ncbi:MAG: class I SAM-dependent methyltransferase [Nitrospirae bacterium]|nr:class I SAM-dependent methyltransferase [Nitrospirota bacterium]MCL5237674.1 class I SAM-dependent methyltransferase [Nitrospirota bacterium]
MIGSYFQKVKKKCWKIIDREYPEGKDKYAIIGNIIAHSARDGDIILDAGCGHKSVIPEAKHLRIKKIGMDLVLEDIKDNKSIDAGLCANMNHIPLKSNSVNIIVCNMVFEHLDKPEAVFAEFNRVLKENGRLIFMTPCIYNIVTFINRLIPNRLHKKVSKLLTGQDESDVFPTFYRANSIGRLRKTLRENHLVEEDLIMYQPPPYAFVFSAVICRLVIRYYRFINRYDNLKFLRGVIIARYRKHSLPV